MGVIIKQSFWGTIISYLGVAIAYINTLYFRAEYLTLEQIGHFTLITAHAMMISPISALGSASSYIKFFPSFKKREQNKLFSFLFFVCLVGIAFIWVIGYFFKDSIASRYLAQIPEYMIYIIIICIIIFSNGLFELFFSYSRSIMKVIFPSFLREIYLRIGSIFLIIGYVLSWWSFNNAINGLGIVYFTALLLLYFWLALFHKFRFDFGFKKLVKAWGWKIFQFSGFSMLFAGSFALYNNATFDQITAYIGPEAMGIFQTCFFIAIIIEMPRRNMSKVVTPIISTDMKRNNISNLRSIYIRSSITMSVIGGLLFIGIITNIEDLFEFIPKGEMFREGYWVVIFICVAKLISILSSFSGEVINFSPRYKYNLMLQGLAAFLLIAINYFLIPIYGINGAALAFLIATFLHNLLKVLYVYYHYGLLPFNKSLLYLLGISIITLLLALVFNPSCHPVLRIGMRSIITGAAFISLVYFFKISTDINNLIDKVLKVKAD